MGIWDDFGIPGKEKERRDETEIDRTCLKDGEETRVLGGKIRKEIIEGEERISEERDNLLKADDGIITTANPNDHRYPHIAGKDYQGNLISAGNLYRCMEKGCDRMVSNMSGVEYKRGLWRCTDHYKK